MRRKDQDNLRDRIDKLFEQRKQEKSKAKPSEPKTNPRVEEPKTPPRARGAERLRRSPIDDNEDEEIFLDPEDPIFNLSPILPRQQVSRPMAPPRIEPEQWQPGNIRRTMTFEKGHPKTATEEVAESNLNHMERVANKQFDDAKHSRETYAKMQRESEERAYADRERARQAALQKQQMNNKMRQEQHAMDNNMTLQNLWAEGEREMRKSQAKLNKQLEANRQKMREETVDLERKKMDLDAEIAKQQAILRQQKIESKRLREQAELESKEQRKREKARRQAMKDKYEFEQLMAEAEAQVHREDNKQTQQLARMEYQDRDNQRKHTRNVELGLAQLHNKNMNNQRRYDLLRMGLENADELATVYDRLRDNAQLRYFRGAAFKDARAKNHVQHVNVDKEQRGMLRERAVRDLFEEFDLGDPDVMDLTEPRISMPQRRLRHTACSSYIHSYIITGVHEIQQNASAGRPLVIFTDGTTRELPAWRNGYALIIRTLRPYVYLVNVFKQSVDMVDERLRNKVRKGFDDDHSGRCPFCCRDCNVQ